MAGYVTAKCRRCGAKIVWATTAKGKTMPVDFEANPDGNVILITEFSGPPVANVVSYPMEPGEVRHHSHFATCLRPKPKPRKRP